MTAYYNEHDPKAAAWLRELIHAGHIAPGHVDERSINDVQAAELVGFTQCHFFAGVGGWSLALRLAGWPDDRPVWTGSCPCQPFSQAGKGKGTADARHLWPDFRRLIAELDPSTVLGEQVASPAGRAWLASVRLDLEALGYAVGAADLCSAGIGAPHIRQRLYWLADSGRVGVRGGELGAADGEAGGMPSEAREQRIRLDAGSTGAAGVLGVANSHRQRRDRFDPLLRADVGGRYTGDAPETAGRGADDGVADGDGPRLEGRPRAAEGCHERTPRAGGVGCGLADDASDGRRQGGQVGGWCDPRGDADGRPRPADGCSHHGPDATHPGWRAVDWLGGRDERWRPVEPGSFPLAHGVPGRVGLLRGYGNAIQPQTAAVFIQAAMSV